MAMLNYEASMCNAFDRVVTMTREDAAFLRSYSPRANIRAIPIGIDADCFQPVRDTSPNQPARVLFVGNFRHPPNVEAAQFLIDEVATHFREIEFIIAGSYVPETLEKLPNVSFPGYVPDTRALFQTPNTIFAAPLFSGTGQRVKLLEAFAMEAAVVTTTVGAFGFPIENGKQAMIADKAEDFRTAVGSLVGSPRLRSQLGKDARQMIVSQFTWKTIGRQFLDLVQESGRG